MVKSFTSSILITGKIYKIYEYLLYLNTCSRLTELEPSTVGDEKKKKVRFEVPCKGLNIIILLREYENKDNSLNALKYQIYGDSFPKFGQVKKNRN